MNLATQSSATSAEEIRESDTDREMNLATQSSATSAEEVRESVVKRTGISNWKNDIAFYWHVGIPLHLNWSNILILASFFQFLHGDRVHCADDDIAMSWRVCCGVIAAVQIPDPYTQEEEAEV